ncbi:MAG: murein biosynthesis integral membrane protein MurJ [Chloroflexota bacterium]
MAANSVVKQSNSKGPSIGSAALLIMIFFVLSRIAGVLREVIIGAQFGLSPELDAYVAAFRVPDLLFQLVAGGALGSAFIPTFSEFWVKGDRAGAWLLLSRVLNLITLLLVILAGIAAFLALPIVQRMVPDFPLDQQILTANLMRWMLLGTVVFGASGLVMGALNAVQHFLLPAAAPIFYNLAIILGALFLTPFVGIYGVAVGAAFGSVCHLLIQLPALVQHKFRYSFDFTLRDSAVLQVGKLMGPRALGLFAVQMQFLVNTILAGRLDSGSLSALNYGMLLMLLPQGIFAQAIATASFPTFAAQVAAGQKRLMGETFSRILRLVLFLTLPATVGLFMLRIPLIRVIFERGSFTSDDTILVAFALQFYAVGLVAHSVLEIIVRAFYALQDTLTPVIIGIGAMGLNILLSIWWVNWLSYGGLALANSVATTIEALLLLWLLKRNMVEIPGVPLLWSALRTVAATSVMGYVLWLWADFQPEWILNYDRGGWLIAGSSLLIAIGSYMVAVLLLNRPEFSSELRLWQQRRG